MVAVSSWPVRSSSMNAGTMSTGDGSSSLPAGIDARCQSTRKTTKAIRRQTTMLIRPNGPERRVAPTAGIAAVGSMVSTLTDGGASAARTVLAIAHRCDRFVRARQPELRLVGNHVADAAPQVGAPLDELGGGAEVIAPARPRQ